jgi:hypothetical protein
MRPSVHPVRVTYHESPEREAELRALADQLQMTFAAAQRLVNVRGLEALRIREAA